MDPGLSPFQPGQLAPVERFVGRRHEIERLYQMARASTRGRLTTVCPGIQAPSFRTASDCNA